MKISRLAMVAVTSIGLVAPSMATVLPNGTACSIVGNVNALQLNSGAGFSFTLKNILAVCNGAVVSNPELVGCSEVVDGVCTKPTAFGLGSWNISYSNPDVTLQNRQQSLVQAAAAAGMKVNLMYSPSSTVPSVIERTWNMLNPGFLTIQVP